MHEADPYNDQVPRKERYEAAHPEVRITCGFGGIWYAKVPGRDTDLTRISLRHLLDVLEALDEPP